MKHMRSRLVVLGLSVLFAVTARAQGSFVLTNTANASESQVFTNSSGTAVLTNGMIVFEGYLSASNLAVAAASDTQGSYLASVQLLVQTKLFDELPGTNEVGSVQGAVAALRDSPNSSNGTYYVWGATNNVMTWIPLRQTNSTLFAVTNSAINYIMFVFKYVASSNTYQVRIGETSSSQIPSEPVRSLSPETVGINGVSLFGSGALQTYGAVSGSPAPLSSSIGFSVYATSKGVLLIVDTVDETGDKPIIVYALINGVWTEVGRVTPNGSGSNHYEFLASRDLVVGQAYSFQITDERGDPYSLGEPIKVKTIKMDSVMMTPEVMSVTFTSEAGRSYQVLVADSLDAVNWEAEAVRYPIDGGEECGLGPFTVNGDSTTIKIPMPSNIGDKPKRFFKIIKTN